MAEKKSKQILRLSKKDAEIVFDIIKKSPEAAEPLKRAMAKRDESLAPSITMEDRIALIVVLAKEVFENEKEAREWLSEPQYEFSNEIPMELIKTEAGFRQVESLLHRIEHGVI